MPPTPKRVRKPKPKPPQGFTLTEINFDQCHWAITPHYAHEHRFCGNPGFPWCEEHTKQAWLDSSKSIRGAYRT
jgi:hypothetical protein